MITAVRHEGITEVWVFPRTPDNQPTKIEVELIKPYQSVKIVRYQLVQDRQTLVFMSGHSSDMNEITEFRCTNRHKRIRMLREHWESIEGRL